MIRQIPANADKNVQALATKAAYLLIDQKGSLYDTWPFHQSVEYYEAYLALYNRLLDNEAPELADEINTPHPFATLWHTEEYPLGWGTGSNADAELYGVAAALKHAASRVSLGVVPVRRVLVFTDNLENLKALAEGGQLPLGPFLAGPLAVDELYDVVDWLVQRGVGVELPWVKRHAGRRGIRRP
ncbi:hypothetical protein K458DRAFT_385594 [Lentithecium fluviatile CBS 122367]|uniref:Uncharacterized protein n=1 Tax=Lentithecium fluviatile CBS 122367 TaxID=1168545 RepID=A0A6G1JCT6_9PLEO|nr:hypothetical protein K458DRAFT_385594 [Lentithecium fluviatile CBS 122367]